MGDSRSIAKTTTQQRERAMTPESQSPRVYSPQKKREPLAPAFNTLPATTQNAFSQSYLSSFLMAKF